MKQFNTREELLQDAIDYYWGRPERKCINENRVCVYSPREGSKSEGCAIGRLLPPALANKLDNYPGATGVSNIDVFLDLPNWMQDLGQEFLSELQSLHDSSYFSNKDVDSIHQLMCDYVTVDNIVFPN